MKSGIRLLMQNVKIILIAGLLAGFSTAGFSSTLSDIEKHYQKAQSVKMDVQKTLKLKLLGKEKTSQGVIQIKKGGFLRWETEEPNHSLVLADGRFIWLVDYTEGEDEKPNIIKAVNPKKSQPHAVVAFLLGAGRISDDFKVTSEKDSDGLTKLELKPKHSEDAIKWLKLFINKDKAEIESLAFEDSVGNETDLEFQKIQFDSPIKMSVFKFSPPKGADITILN